MKKRIIRALAFLLMLAAVFSAAAFAAGDLQSNSFAGRTMESIVTEFREKYHLNEYNFALSYYNTVTGETYHFNETELMVAASTYKMPLNLYYYKMELAGEIESDAFIPNSGVTLNVAHQRSLVDSNNEISEAMLYNLGKFRDYKQKMCEFFTMTEDEIGPDFYFGNLYCSRMMLDALRYLYEHSEEYSEMLGYMKQAQPEAYFRRLVGEYEIAHKYGSYEGAENDVGIIYAKQPFLLAVYTHNAGGEEVCAQIARLLTDYTDYYADAYAREQQAQQARLAAEQAEKEKAAQEAEEKAQEEKLRVEAEAAAEAEAAKIAETAVQTVIGGADAPTDIVLAPPEKALTWWMIAVAVGICTVGGFGLHFLFRKPGKYEKKYKKKFEKYFKDDEEKSTVG